MNAVRNELAQNHVCFFYLDIAFPNHFKTNENALSTCDLSDGPEHIQSLRIQSTNTMIHVSVKQSKTVHECKELKKKKNMYFYEHCNISQILPGKKINLCS